MKELLQNLLRLQALQFNQRADKNTEAKLAEIRAKIPAPILGHYDRLAVRGKRGVALVRNQVCTGCHMCLPIGVIAKLIRGEDLLLCDSCGRYLYLPDEPEDHFISLLENSRPVQKPKSRRSKELINAAA